MIWFSRNDSLINSNLVTPIGGFNFTFKVSFDFFDFIFLNEYSTFYVLYQNIISAFLTTGSMHSCQCVKTSN